MNVGSLFSGIGGIDLGLERAGMRVVFQCEADPWRRAVLRSHWPDVPCWEDVREVACEERDGRRRQLGSAGLRADAGKGAVERDSGAHVDLICGGFPCQDLSVAGRRAGLQGERSGLFFEFARIADALRPRWLLIENVPGLLSSNGGRDFAVVYATLAELGYGLAWRILDSRHFGVPQRRRRVFVVGHLGARSAAPFLPFLEGGAGDPEAGGEAGADVTPALSGRSPSRLDDQGSGQLVTGFHHIQDPISSEDETPALGQDGMAIAGTVRSHMRPGSNSYDSVVDVAYALRKDPGGVGQGHNTNYIAAPLSHGSNPNSNAAGRRREDDENLVAFDWQSGGDVRLNISRETSALVKEQTPAVTAPTGVRRLTPTECCRLQGFPDDWLGPPNQPPDSPKYAALGDAVTVPVAHRVGLWILEADRDLGSVAA